MRVTFDTVTKMLTDTPRNLSLQDFDAREESIEAYFRSHPSDYDWKKYVPLRAKYIANCLICGITEDRRYMVANSGPDREVVARVLLENTRAFVDI